MEARTNNFILNDSRIKTINFISSMLPLDFLLKSQIHKQKMKPSLLVTHATIPLMKFLKLLHAEKVSTQSKLSVENV